MRRLFVHEGRFLRYVVRRTYPMFGTECLTYASSETGGGIEHVPRDDERKRSGRNGQDCGPSALEHSRSFKTKRSTVERLPRPRSC